ncbi:RNA polymerase sigma factor [Actinoalloteichus spitiensis]|uniref:RNA polymerase sigma factor n=1 Tax=Actinoalloteichus spitiensis TaxID=252394 RepID=UPI00068B12F5|nr:RNA polymerase sigma factor [Actinoalloteichus spitiensis]
MTEAWNERTDEIEDAALALRIAGRDADAFEILVRRYSGRVSRLALRMLGDRGEAEDVTQDVFATVWCRVGELADPGAVRTWLFRIAHRQCLAILRKRRDRRTDPLATIPESGTTAIATAQVDGRFHPERAATASAGVDALYRAVETLPSPQRAVWLMAEVGGVPHAEIAAVVGASEQAVRGRLARARTRLAAVMRAWR